MRKYIATASLDWRMVVTTTAIVLALALLNGCKADEQIVAPIVQPPTEDAPPEEKPDDEEPNTGPNENGNLVASAGVASGEFGGAVAISGDGQYAIVGASHGDGANATGAGDAYVFVRSDAGWTQQARLVASDGEPGDRFGEVVAISADGTYALIGAWGDGGLGAGNHHGSAYVFVRNGDSWSEQARLTSAEGERLDGFGVSVALEAEGRYALIGANGDDGDPASAVANGGAAFVFARDGSRWRESTKLVASDAQPNASFGTTVALSADGRYALVGAELHDGTYEDEGIVYSFARSGDTWTEADMISVPDAHARRGGFFGMAVAISDDAQYAVIGAAVPEFFGLGGGRTVTGDAFVAKRNGDRWDEPVKLTPDDAENGDRFGFSVSLSGDGEYAVIGARQESNGNGFEAGAAYVFLRSGDVWTQDAKLTALDGDAQDLFGVSVAISDTGRYVLVGAPFDDHSGLSDAGAAFVFDSSPTS